MARRSSVNWDGTMRRLFKEVGDDLGIPTGQVEEAFTECMRICTRQMSDLKPVQLVNFGTFHLSPDKTYRLISRMFKSMRNRESGKDPDGMTRDEVRERLQKYWQLHRLANEHNPRTGYKYKLKLKREQERHARAHRQGEDHHTGRPGI